ncbi:hypothetical protein RRG08_048427 [Elysia crispata]|uniref:Uncharacterized protein n=1 Tax=Elysia crispata TaxID=231223 RepID=A0AAE1ECN7_9GAST|nr:hypothetical protein RRG08_048427 [Elysia crispata]
MYPLLALRAVPLLHHFPKDDSTAFSFPLYLFCLSSLPLVNDLRTTENSTGASQRVPSSPHFPPACPNRRASCRKAPSRTATIS